MQQEILEKNPSANLRVYAIWVPILIGDGRGAWDYALMPDARVTHYWDGQQIVGARLQPLPEEIPKRVWDTFALFGPEAKWDDAPAPLRGAGFTIIRTRDRLAEALRPLLTP